MKAQSEVDSLSEEKTNETGNTGIERTWMTARYWGTTTGPAAPRKDCKKHQLNLEAAALTWATKVADQHRTLVLRKTPSQRRESLAPALEQSHPTHSCF